MEKINNRLISIDQSLTCTGVCIFNEDGSLHHFECIKTYKKDNTVVSRISEIANRVEYLYAKYDCNNAVFEQLSFASMGDATRNLAGLLFTIEVKLLERFGLDGLSKIPPTSVKKFATGSGKAKKKDMLDALPEDIYNDFYNEGYLRSKGMADLADAYFIGKFFLDKIEKDNKI